MSSNNSEQPSSFNTSKRLTVDWSKAITMDRTSSVKAETRPPLGSIMSVTSRTRYCTGSEYEGYYNQLGFCGYGIYKYPHGPIYEGEFQNGDFHGIGTITYPMGQLIMQGTWNKGKLICFRYKFKDDLLLDEGDSYCNTSDRRFQCERLADLNPAGFEQLTNDTIPKKLNENCYDTVDGYYNARTLALYSYDDEIIRMATAKERQEIEANYRYWKELPVGYKPSLYETWTTGKADKGRDSEENQSIFDDYGLLGLLTNPDCT